MKVEEEEEEVDSLRHMPRRKVSRWTGNKEPRTERERQQAVVADSTGERREGRQDKTMASG